MNSPVHGKLVVEGNVFGRIQLIYENVGFDFRFGRRRRYSYAHPRKI